MRKASASKNRWKAFFPARVSSLFFFSLSAGCDRKRQKGATGEGRRLITLNTIKRLSMWCRRVNEWLTDVNELVLEYVYIFHFSKLSFASSPSMFVCLFGETKMISISTLRVKCHSVRNYNFTIDNAPNWMKLLGICRSGLKQFTQVTITQSCQSRFEITS